MQAYLDVKDSKGQRRVPLDEGPLTIGRNFTNLLVIEDTQAGRFHCVVEKGAEGFMLRDLDSRNGTKVNGKPVRASVLYDGDVISIGKSEMKLVIPESAAQAAAEADDPFAELAQLVQPQDSTDDSQEPAGAKPQTARAGAPANEFVRQLRERADSLPDRSFSDSDIALVNARGKVAHASSEIREGGDALEIMRLIMLICFRARATDIHVEPKTDDVNIRIRIDGAMVDLLHLNKELGAKLLSLVKVLSDIDIAQRNIVQEGHFSARVPGRAGQGAGGIRQVDYRVSFAPAMHGQKLVIRVLDAANAPLHVEDMQMPPEALSIIRNASRQESGMILVSGPTGSGKTTTLYAILRDIDVNESNVVTIEDPVEIQLEGVTQIPVNESQGNTFSSLLRSVLRQDPDVILVGEIRDAETARVAVQAGMTGHLVFSTVHSRDAMSGMFRLLDLGVEPFVMASGLQLVVAQRLVRQLCAYCKVAQPPSPEEQRRLADNGIAPVQNIFVPKGCRRCLGTGHLGRRAVFEVVVNTPALREVMLKSPTMQECQRVLDRHSYITLAQSGYRLVAAGVTDFDELERSIK
jgi:general secretion pathway protein E